MIRKLQMYIPYVTSYGCLSIHAAKQMGGVAEFLPLVTFRGLQLTSVTSDNKIMQIYIYIIIFKRVLCIHTINYVHWCCQIGIMSFNENNSIISFS